MTSLHHSGTKMAAPDAFCSCRSESTTAPPAATGSHGIIVFFPKVTHVVLFSLLPTPVLRSPATAEAAVTRRPWPRQRVDGRLQPSRGTESDDGRRLISSRRKRTVSELTFFSACFVQFDAITQLAMRETVVTRLLDNRIYGTR